MSLFHGPAVLRPDDCLHQLFERRAQDRPDAPAVIAPDGTLTYRRLDLAAERIACALQARGALPERFVAVGVERSAALVALLTGIAKAGAAFVPVDPAGPRFRRDAVLAEAAPVLVVTDTPAAFDACGRSVVSVDELLAAGGDRPVRRDLARPAAPAYVLYTSGSTGLPKGVVVEHRAICNTLLSAIHDVDLRPEDRVLVLAPLTFDPAIAQIFGTLAAGACIVVPPADAGRDAEAIAQTVRAHGVTVIDAVPAQWLALAESGALTDMPTVRTAISGGAALPPALAERCADAGIALYNAYGPTEAAVQATVHRCGAVEHGFVSLGTPIDNMALYVLDADVRPVAAGTPGEIYLAGAGLARGYLNAPGLTAERFLPDPFAGRSDARMYRTGDLARVHADGRLEFLGRNDDQVKIRGVRVELGDVAAKLERHPRVAEAAVIVAAENAERIVAFVVPREPGARLVDELRVHLRELLDPAAQPAAIHIVGALPVLPGGKVDRNALRELSIAHARVDHLTEPPDALYALLLPIWEDVLGVRGIGFGESFFEAGGHSLLAVRLKARVEERVGRSVPVDLFFADPTISGMVRALRAAERAAFEPLVALSPPGPKQPLFFLHGDPSGLGLYCRRFAQAFGAERAVYAIAPHGTDGGPVPETVEAMAGEHLALIRARQPSGPYLLGGYCMGAIVACEVARRLEREGEHVTHLLLIEAQTARPRFSVVEDALTDVWRKSGLPEELCRAWFAERRAIARAVLRRVRPRRADAAVTGQPGNTTRVLAIQQRAVLRYVWHSLRAPATMMCAAGELGGPAAQVRQKWQRLFSALDVRVVPGTHLTALGAHIERLIAEFAAVFERLDASGTIPALSGVSPREASGGVPGR